MQFDVSAGVAEMWNEGKSEAYWFKPSYKFYYEKNFQNYYEF